jgi:predicted RND superfamily exporter protein
VSSGEALTLMEQVAPQHAARRDGVRVDRACLSATRRRHRPPQSLGWRFYSCSSCSRPSTSRGCCPITVLLAVPLGLLGVAAGVLARGFDNNVYTQIGVILLIALVSKNAILIVEFARREADGGGLPGRAALDAAKLRFRPILMTAFSFVLGTLPLLVATGAGAGARVALGTAVFAGLVLATIIGLFATPMLFRVIEGLGDRLSGITPERETKENQLTSV